MRLATVLHEGRRRAAIVEDDRVLVTDVPSLDLAIAHVSDLARLSGSWVGLEDVSFDAPLRPAVVLCAGQNYADHLEEKAPVEVSNPEFFIKAGQTIARPGDPFVLDPRVTGKLDYETELGIVIGAPARFIEPSDAADHIFGYVVLNDVTARDRQLARNAEGGFDLALGPGKNFEGATRLGSTVVTADAIADPQQLEISTVVNGDLRQSNSTGSMVFDAGTILAYLSNLITLRPGTIIATGTPGGTGWGMDPELGGTSVTPSGCVPARYLTVGDEVTSRIGDIGELTFAVVAHEPGGTAGTGLAAAA